MSTSFAATLQAAHKADPTGRLFISAMRRLRDSVVQLPPDDRERLLADSLAPIRAHNEDLAATLADYLRTAPGNQEVGL